ncbi:MAG: hypothetical protein FJ320_12190 [SAR202 cluster bacterium]|nr:hypothetical protein [SAR202 cluster bacterium]
MTNCRDIEDLLPAYSLNALGDEDSALVAQHLEGCVWCQTALREFREVTTRLSTAAEQTPPPARVLKNVLKGRPAPRPRRGPSLVPAFALSTAVLVIVILGSVLAFMMAELRNSNETLTEQVASLEQDNESVGEEVANLRGDNQEVARQVAELGKGSAAMAEKVDHLTTESTQLGAKVTEVTREGKDLVTQMYQLSISGQQSLDALKTQRHLLYLLALPDTQVSDLSSTNKDIEGRVIFNPSTQNSILVVTGLTMLSSSMQYQAWLRKSACRPESQGPLSVDDKGWGMAVLEPVDDFGKYQWLGVSVEAADGSAAEPTAGQVILFGMLTEADPVRP